jgi:CBS domain-containing membrane protein
MPSAFLRLRRFVPDALTIDARERARSVLGALLGIFLTGLLCQLATGNEQALPWLVAPMGASAVLLFAVPASPLAQPWPVIGGNVISALVGITCAQFISIPLAAACIAVAAAIALMFALRCLHPPGGAVALGAAIGGTGMAKLGYWFALFPVGLNSLLMVLAAVAYNNLCGRRYPHLAVDRSNKHGTADVVPLDRIGITPAHLDAALKQHNELLDISRDDLEEILVSTQMQAYHRRFGEVTCADIMSRDVLTVEFGTSLQEAWRSLREHDVKALPVIDRFRRVIGIVTQRDFIKQCDIDAGKDIAARLRSFLTPTPGPHSDKPEVVGQIMTSHVFTATSEQPIASLVQLFSDNSLHYLPVVDSNQKLVGIITQTDLLAVLYMSQVDQATARPRKRAQ